MAGCRGPAGQVRRQRGFSGRRRCGTVQTSFASFECKLRLLVRLPIRFVSGFSHTPSVFLLVPFLPNPVQSGRRGHPPIPRRPRSSSLESSPTTLRFGDLVRGSRESTALHPPSSCPSTVTNNAPFLNSRTGVLIAPSIGLVTSDTTKWPCPRDNSRAANVATATVTSTRRMSHRFIWLPNTHVCGLMSFTEISFKGVST